MKDYYVSIKRSNDRNESYIQKFVVSFPEDEVISVMNVLEEIYHKLDPTLAFFSHAACKQAACGKCMVRKNGKVVLACKELAADEMLLEPYNSKVIRDLMCRG
ncbi:MAG: 2Fe-2S iron-sulfur cluster-binding protein [Lachnospiraceae bacterium]